MTTELRIEYDVHFRRRAYGANHLHGGADPGVEEWLQVPHVAGLMALALKYEGLLRSGAVKDYAALARLGKVTRARVSQVMSLIHLAPQIQEELLFLPPASPRRAGVILADLQPIAALHDWERQRRCWRRLRR